MSRFHRLIFVLTLAALVAMASAVVACPTCGEGLMQADPHAQSIAAGFKYSIIFMLSMPYVCLGTLCSIAYYSIRKAKAQQALADEPTDK